MDYYIILRPLIGAGIGSLAWAGNALFEGASRKELKSLIADADNDLIRND